MEIKKKNNTDNPKKLMFEPLSGELIQANIDDTQLSEMGAICVDQINESGHF